MLSGSFYRNAKKLFEHAREKKPSILFIDEIDGLFSKRGKNMHNDYKQTTNHFLKEMSELEPGILVVGTTNLPHHLDSAFIRRFQVLFYYKLC